MSERLAAILGALMTASADYVSRSSIARSCTSNVHPCQSQVQSGRQCAGNSLCRLLFRGTQAVCSEDTQRNTELSFIEFAWRLLHHRCGSNLSMFVISASLVEHGKDL
jgi:hypothetical protein